MPLSFANFLTFQSTVPLHLSPCHARLSPWFAPNQFYPRCSIQPPQRHNSTTRRAFLAHLLGSFFLSSTQTKAQHIIDTSLDSAPNPTPPISTTSPQSQTSPPPPPPSARDPTWGYSPENGPETWADLSEDWNIAATGIRQSPIPLSYRTAISSTDIPRPTLATNPAKFTIRVRNLPAAAKPSLCVEPYVPPPPPLVGDAPPVDTYTPPPIPALITLPATSAAYALRSIHFHVAAEHVIETLRAPMELQFVFERVLRKSPPPTAPSTTAPAPANADADSPDSIKQQAPSSSSPLSVPAAEAAENPNENNNSSSPKAPAAILVVAMLATLAETSAPWFASALHSFTATAGQDGKGPGIVTDLDMGSILPSLDQSNFYMYMGSLTAPPCTEGVQWLVLSSRLSVKQSDVDTVIAMQGGSNARPLQEVNGRNVIRFPSISSST